jgi:hypothetical protein
MSAPTIHHGDVLTVFEGARRLSWRRDLFTEWTPVGLWPDQHASARLRRHLADAKPLLVVVERPETTVTLLAEQYEAAAPEVAALAGGDVSGEIVDIRLPALDWLPDDLRRRGIEFLRRSTAQVAATPAALRPPVRLEDPDAAAPNVRFVHRSGPWLIPERDLPALAEAAFREQQYAVAA